MKEVIEQVRGMIREAKDDRNDGYIKEGYKKELTKIFNLIDRELHLRYAEVDGLEVGSKEDYE